MTLYKATYRYKLLSLCGIIIGCASVFLGLLSLILDSFFNVLVMVLPGIFLLYLLLLVFPTEILTNDKCVEFRTKLRKVNLKYSEIKEVKPYYTTRSLTLEGGDKDKAAVYYSIKIKNKPLTLLLFGTGIYKYRELCEHLNSKIHQ